MNRKDNTIKQLQAECKKRGIGFMTNWTKIALTKRLEDEDKKDKELLEVKEKLQSVEKKIKAMPSKKSVQNDINKKIRLEKEDRLRKVIHAFNLLHEEQNKLFERTNKIASDKAKLHKEITTIEEIIKSLI